MLKNKPIRDKLMMIILMTSGVSLVLTCVTFLVYDFFTYRDAIVKQTEVLARMCAANSTAALAFDNSDDAEEVLSTLNVAPEIVAAVLYDENDSVFAKYPDTVVLKQTKLENAIDGFSYKSEHLVGFLPVTQNNTRLGTLYILTDLGAIYQRLQLFGSIAISVLIISMFVAYILSSALQRSISLPILSLAGTARLITEKKDYSVRAQMFDQDEIGLLTGAFNAMLSEIEKQNLQITSFNQGLEKLVNERTNELELAYSEMEAFSYSVSHDLNAPLRQIDSFIELYIKRSGDDMDPDGKYTLNKIASKAGKMRNLIEDLLLFSRLSRTELKKSEVMMKRMATSICNDLVKSESGRKITIQIGDMPNVFADSSAIKQVWHNLISNALKYTKYETEAVIRICSETEGRNAIYSVHDNGVGFDAKHSDQLFKAFQRMHSTKYFEGTGIGLAIVERVVAKHGGKVWAQGEPDKGAKFYFSIPMSPPNKL